MYPIETPIFQTDYYESFVNPVSITSLLQERRYAKPIEFLPLQLLRKQYQHIENIFEKPITTSKTKRDKMEEAKERRFNYDPLIALNNNDEIKRKVDDVSVFCLFFSCIMKLLRECIQIFFA